MPGEEFPSPDHTLSASVMLLPAVKVLEEVSQLHFRSESVCESEYSPNVGAAGDEIVIA